MFQTLIVVADSLSLYKPFSFVKADRVFIRFLHVLLKKQQQTNKRTKRAVKGYVEVDFVHLFFQAALFQLREQRVTDSVISIGSFHSERHDENVLSFSYGDNGTHHISEDECCT